MNARSFLLGMLAGALTLAVVAVNRAQQLVGEARNTVLEFVESLFPWLFF